MGKSILLFIIVFVLFNEQISAKVAAEVKIIADGNKKVLCLDPENLGNNKLSFTITPATPNDKYYYYDLKAYLNGSNIPEKDILLKNENQSFIGFDKPGKYLVKVIVNEMYYDDQEKVYKLLKNIGEDEIEINVEKTFVPYFKPDKQTFLTTDEAYDLKEGLYTTDGKFNINLQEGEGTFSGQEVVAGKFNPKNLDPGIYEVTYTIKSALMCESTTKAYFEVRPPSLQDFVFKNDNNNTLITSICKENGNITCKVKKTNAKVLLINPRSNFKKIEYAIDSSYALVEVDTVGNEEFARFHVAFRKEFESKQDGISFYECKPKMPANCQQECNEFEYDCLLQYGKSMYDDEEVVFNIPIKSKTIIIKNLPTTVCQYTPNFLLKTNLEKPDYSYKLEPDGEYIPFNGPIVLSGDNMWAAGKYKIKAEVKNGNGCDAIIEKSFEIQSAPSPIFTEQNIGCGNYEFFYPKGNAEGMMYEWDFGDGTTLKDFTLQAPILHSYATPGKYKVKLIASNYKSYICKSIAEKEINVNSIREAAFDIQNLKDLCIINNGQDKASVTFINLAKVKGDNEMLAEITDWIWDFGDNIIEKYQTDVDVPHDYKPGIYKVTLTVITQNKCQNSISKTIHISALEKPTASKPYLQDFENNDHGWGTLYDDKKIEGKVVAQGKSSWVLKTPTGKTINKAASGNAAWITADTSNTYYMNENSWVESPCISLANLQKPYVSFNIWSHTEKGADGVALQYTLDNGETWLTLGQEDIGANWYDSFILGQPGGFFTNPNLAGWSGSEAKGWKKAAYNLQDVKTELLKLGTTILKFRVIFGSNGLNKNKMAYDGFAFDDFYIGERNRVVLKEHFMNTQATNPNQIANNSPNEANKDDVKIAYFTDYPAENEYNAYNPADPSARALLYGLVQPPRTAIDGNFINEVFDQSTFNKNYTARLLDEAPFEIIIELSKPKDALEIKANVEKIRETQNVSPIVHIAIVENKIEGLNYSNVLRNMLPNASGNRIAEDWNVDEIKSITQSWNSFRKAFPHTFGVVVFVQDEFTKEIYQTTYKSINIELPAPPANKEKLATLEALEQNLQIYPNPTAGKINVSFGNKIAENISWEIYDVYGRKILNGLSATTNHFTISLQNHSNGIYFLHLVDKDHGRVIRKINLLK